MTGFRHPTAEDFAWKSIVRVYEYEESMLFECCPDRFHRAVVQAVAVTRCAEDDASYMTAGRRCEAFDLSDDSRHRR